MILLTPETIRLKDAWAHTHVGRHLLIGIATKSGYVVGKMGNNRLQQKNRPSIPPWISVYDDRIYVVSTGNLGDIREYHTHVLNSLEDIEGSITAENVTIKGAERIARTWMLCQYNSDTEIHPYGINTVLFPVDHPGRFSLINFNGTIKWFDYFVVAGGLDESPECHEARQRAIAHLMKRCGRGQFMTFTKDAEGRAGDLIVETIQRFDPVGSSAIVEIAGASPGYFRWKTRRISKKQKTK